MSWFSNLFKQVRQLLGIQSFNEKIIQTLEEHTKDLVFISETDGYFSTIQWTSKEDLLDSKKLRKYLNKVSDLPIQQITVEQFFKNKQKIKEHYSDKKKASALRFQQLVSCINSNLENPTVFKIGQIKKEVYIIGQVKGDYIGLKTNVVET